MAQAAEAPSGGAPECSYLDLDLHFRLVEVAHDHGGRRTDRAESFAENREDALHIGTIGHVVMRAHHIRHFEPRLGKRRADRSETVSRLRLDALGHRHRGIVIAGGARNEAPVALHHGAAVAGSLLEWRAGRDQSAHRCAGPTQGRAAATFFSNASMAGAFLSVSPISSSPFKRQCLRKPSISKCTTPPSGP